MLQALKQSSVAPESVFAVILGGGQGTRLFPLTKDRAKPAVPLAGKYRLVDIPISNCINSGYKRMYLLTQFNSASLHRHIALSYKFDHFSEGFVEILAAQRTLTDTSWYEGTADAIRKNLIHVLNHSFEYLLILSGDQLYRMDYRTMLEQHVEKKAQVTVATIPVPRRDVVGFGIMQIDSDSRIARFVEKPKEPEIQQSLKLEREFYPKLGISGHEELFLASMGIYVFNRDVLVKLLDTGFMDFGKHVIPQAIHTHRVFAHVFQGYWEDIGTIRAFFEANLELTSVLPRFNFFDMSAPIFTEPLYLPASKVNGGNFEQSLISDGCIVDRAHLRHCLLGIRSLVGQGSHLERTVVLGNDLYESAESIAQHEAQGLPRIGIGKNARIQNAIIDKNARIGNDCVISPGGKPNDLDHPLYYIRDGIVVIPKNGAIPHGTVI